MSWHQKKHSLTHTHEEEGFTQTTRSALSQRGLLDQIKPACNKSWPVGQVKLTGAPLTNYGSVCRQSSLQYLLLSRTRCILLSTSSITACFLLDFVVQGNMQTDRQSVWMTPHPDCRCPYLHHLLHFFMQNVREWLMCSKVTHHTLNSWLYYLVIHH